MKRLFTKRWLMPLAGLVCGLVTGIAFRSAKTSEPGPSAKSLAEKRTAASPSVAAPPPALPLPSYDKLRSSKYTNLEDQIRLEQSALNLSPAEALRLALKHENDCRGPNPFAAKLLWYLAAKENPEQVLKLAEKVINNQANTLPLEGIFAAWVATDPAAALAAAEATPMYWNGNHSAADYCIAAWAERDSAACARALEGKTLTDSGMNRLLAGWTARDPRSALAWVEQRDRKQLPAAYREWAASDPVKASEAAIAFHSAHSAADSDSLSASCALAAIHPLIQSAPELALKTACKGLSGLTMDVRIDMLANDLESELPGAGEAFALAMPPGEGRFRAMGWVADKAVQRGDLPHAKELINTLSTPGEMWPAVSGPLVHLALHDPEMGHAWLMELRTRMDTKTFALAAQNFNDHVIRTAPAMAVDYADNDGGQPN